MLLFFILLHTYVSYWISYIFYKEILSIVRILYKKHRKIQYSILMLLLTIQVYAMVFFEYLCIGQQQNYVDEW